MSAVQEILSVVQLKKKLEEKKSNLYCLYQEAQVLKKESLSLGLRKNELDQHRKRFIDKKLEYLFFHIDHEIKTVKRIQDELRFRQSSPLLKKIKKIDEHGNKIIYTLASIVLGLIIALLII